MSRHNIRNSPLIISPGTNHYSWPKGATLLGIGQSNVIAVHVDRDARQNVVGKILNISHLLRILLFQALLWLQFKFEVIQISIFV